METVLLFATFSNILIMIICAGRAVASVMFSKHICNPPPPIYCGVCASIPLYIVVYRANVTFLGSIPLYIVVQGLNSPPFDYRPQYIVVGNVDKNFFDYIIIAKTKRPATAFRVFSHLKISLVLLFITFSTKELLDELH